MDDSISYWIVHLKQGNETAARELWETYFQQLVQLARGRLGRSPRRVADEEDIALSVFDSLCRGATRGRFPRLSDRTDLWSLLMVITARKVCDHVQAGNALKRGGGRTIAVSDLGDEGGAAALDAVLSREPSPETAAIFAEECGVLLNRLDEDLRQLALGRLEGKTNEELARELNCGLRTIERRLELIRRVWSEPETGST